MGTIAQKLEYLNDTRLLLKDNINKINNVLDDNSTFRSYPQELFNGYLDVLNNGTDTLWNNLEKVSASGEEVTLENVETAPIKMVPNGNTSQDGTPTPDTPVEVKVVKGENVVSVSGKNKIDLTKHTNTLASNTTILNSNTYQCEVTASWQGKIIVPLDLKNNSTYTISASNDSTATRSIIDKIYGYNGATSTTIVTSQYFDYFKNGYRFNSGEYERYEMIIYITGNSSQTGLLLLKDLMIELGSTATPYVPYSKTDYPINLVSKNKLDLSKIVKGRLDNGIIGYESGTTSLETTNNELTFATNTNYRGVTTDYIEIKNGDFIFFDWLSTNNDNLQVSVAYYDKDKNYISQTSGYSLTNAFRFSNNVENSKYIRVYMSLTVAGEITIQEPQVEFASNVNEFEEYFNIELCKINTYKDYFHKDSGKWYVHKEINKIVFNGSENFTIYSSNTSRVVFLINISGDIVNYVDVTKVPNLICSHFVAVTQNKTWANGDISRHTANQKGLYFTTKADETIDTFKNWLSSNNVSVYYPLATPTETEITNSTLIEQLEAISKAKSVKDKTYITQTNDELPFILDVEAIKEYEVN